MFLNYLIFFLFAYTHGTHIQTDGTDYTAQVVTLSFNQGMRLHTVSVPILQDNIKEEKEQFQANLELVDNNGLSVVIRPAVANVTIIDSNIGECYSH